LSAVSGTSIGAKMKIANIPSIPSSSIPLLRFTQLPQ
jgi:hypothetical protein